MKFKLEGIIPAILTPFTKGGEQVDYEKACALATRLADQGVAGVFVAGTTGEGFLMTVEERKKLLEELIAAAGKRIKIIAQTGHFDTATVIELSQHAMEAGAAAAGVVAPGFYGYDDASLRLHYKLVAKAVKDFPILLYNLPGCAKNLLTAELIVELAEGVDNIVGIKDSSGMMALFSRVLGDRPKEFVCINGADEYSFQAYAAGADGSVSSTANVFPDVFLGIFNNMKKGDTKKAWKYQVMLNRLCGVFQYGKMVAYYKEGMRLRGFDAGYVRAPQRELTAAERKAFTKKLEGMGVL